jgi:hypothetical protein
VIVKVDPPKPVVPVPVPPPPKPEPPKPAASAVALAAAAQLIREATPEFNQLADILDPAKMPDEDVRAQLARVDAVDRKLNRARAEYVRILPEAPDRSLVERRIAALDELIRTLEWGLERVRLPRMLHQASIRIREALPLVNRITTDGGTLQASELRTLTESALTKLKDARSLYGQVKATSPQPELMAARIRQLDGLIGTLEAGR